MKAINLTPMSVNFVKKTSLVATVFAAIFLMTGCDSGPKLNYDEFAQCVDEVGMVEYGAFWCHNCETQKDLFGKSFEYITYIECDPRGDESQAEFCLDQGIEAYPTWTHPDGRRWEGVLSMEQLSQVSGCELPQEITE